jgi:hypothetical protein
MIERTKPEIDNTRPMTLAVRNCAVPAVSLGTFEYSMIRPHEQSSTMIIRVRHRTLKNPRGSDRIQAMSEITRKSALNHPMIGMKDMALKTTVIRKNWRVDGDSLVFMLLLIISSVLIRP